MNVPASLTRLTPARPATSRRAFTLLELLVVFTIILVLIGVVLMVGQKIAHGSKNRSTQNVLQSLDQALEAYVQAKGGTAGKFPDRFIDASAPPNEFPLADARIAGTLVPSGELAVELLKNEPASSAIIQKIPAEFVEMVDGSTQPPAGPFPNVAGQYPKRRSTGGPVDITFSRIKDAWGRPIRFVHPSYHGIYGTGANPARDISLRQAGSLNTVQITRDWQVSTGGGDPTFSGEGDGGLCMGGRPYFYSAGPDGNPATVADNVYSVRPTFDAAVKAAGQ